MSARFKKALQAVKQHGWGSVGALAVAGAVLASWFYAEDLLVIGVAALAAIAMTTAIAIHTRRIYWYLLATLLAAGWFLYLILAQLSLREAQETIIKQRLFYTRSWVC